MYERNPVTGTMLQVLADELDAGGILYRSFAATDLTSMSRGKNAAYWKTAEFVIRTLAELHRRGWTAIESRPDYNERTPYEKPIYRTPTNRQMLVFLARLLHGIAGRQLYKRVFDDKWYVGYWPRSAAAVEIPPRIPSSPLARGKRFRRLASPRPGGSPIPSSPPTRVATTCSSRTTTPRPGKG